MENVDQWAYVFLVSSGMTLYTKRVLLTTAVGGDLVVGVVATTQQLLIAVHWQMMKPNSTNGIVRDNMV